MTSSDTARGSTLIRASPTARDAPPRPPPSSRVAAKDAPLERSDAASPASATTDTSTLAMASVSAGSTRSAGGAASDSVTLGTAVLATTGVPDAMASRGGRP